jgi:hypothetical protein
MYRTITSLDSVVSSTEARNGCTVTFDTNSNLFDESKEQSMEGIGIIVQMGRPLRMLGKLFYRRCERNKGKQTDA